jgi:pimeloyl-ACP methyl ester carboxylesterase
MVQRPETDPARTAVVGASIGANLALVTAAEESAVGAVVALSPGLDYQGIETLDAVSGLSGRPLLFVASREDSYAFESAETLSEAAPSSEIIRLNDAGHGTAMLGNTPDLPLTVITWLSRFMGVTG